MTNDRTGHSKSLATKPMKAFVLVIAMTFVVATIACRGSENVVQTVIVEKEEAVAVESEVVVEATLRPVAEAASAVRPAPVVKTSPPVQLSQPGTTTFQNTSRSNFALTSQDGTSTFSRNIDRTLFQLAQNWTRSGLGVHLADEMHRKRPHAYDYVILMSATDPFAILTASDKNLDNSVR